MEAGEDFHVTYVHLKAAAMSEKAVISDAAQVDSMLLRRGMQGSHQFRRYELIKVALAFITHKLSQCLEAGRRVASMCCLATISWASFRSRKWRPSNLGFWWHGVFI